MVTAFPTKKICPPQILEKIISDSNQLSVRLTEAKFRLYQCLLRRIGLGLIVFPLHHLESRLKAH
ncbi:MAG: hypothetical protein EWV55_09070 [Microcystis viridis Mv_BB_P_19951000_S69]|uniref:Uncharacterized protein n=1 Tax=Microcystis viridis Mv_BB_P_19951000_S68D TaxID=2486270 RepID=A0A552HWS5_MICVR|nr:MAG: hypothetical protein EWV47_21935 [Microcystis viridis Mv_BB_P_19951000_S68]TRU75460.1 MAG: hypothetical protein EWV55_09070 [Microcystis viridis Mv_BB_P_19951000_S69]TRU75674.1 MAG: hypothetical protein EWV77_08260 [Microcystis viridis Mv_BB_P_19951000_S68D]TRU82641.1 MAG: hypothetical protein EWV46_18300 [Microcystis viridis Mv_BB_P_19951000_S69D]